jgi:flavin-dependent dehydrogenase
LVVDRSSLDGHRWGETLPGQATPLLARLGLAIQDFHQQHLSVPGMAADWTDAGPHEYDASFSPHGPGWHLNRARFNADLRRLAVAAGAQVWCRARVRRLRRTTEGWEALFETPHGERSCSAGWLIDASGRGSLGEGPLPVRRLRLDRLVAAAALVPVALEDLRTRLAAARSGWWYLAPVPGGQAVVCYFTDADLLPRPERLPAHLQEQWPLAGPWPAALLAQVRRWRLLPAHSARRAPAAGERWLAIGDAAQSRDPLTSQGILWALESGLRGAAAVDRQLAGLQGLPDYSAWLSAAWNEYLQHRRYYYGQVRRWPASAFWRRRVDSATLDS